MSDPTAWMRDEYEVLASNTLDDGFDASPAIVDDEIYMRGYRYLYAIADAMSEEYRAIVDAGFLLQIDDPRLVTYYVANPQASVEDCRR